MIFSFKIWLHIGYTFKGVILSRDIKSKKYTGVYFRICEDKSKTFYIVYKNPITKKATRLKIGTSKEGINETYCHNKRSEILSKLRLGEDTNIPILKAKTQKLTLNDIAIKYFESKSMQGTSRSTKDRENKYNKHYSHDIGLLPLQMITKNDLINLQKSLIKLGYASATINNTLQLGSTIFKYSIENELYSGINPFSKVKSLKSNNTRIRYLTREEIKKLKRKVKEDEILYLFVLLALTTGGRLNTILNIQKKDIDINNNIISLYDLKNKSHYNGTLTDEVKKILSPKFSTLKDNDFIVSYDSLQMNEKKIQNRLRPILDKLFNKDLKENDTINRVVIHTLRHTFASLLAIDGIPIYTIQKLMNHKDIKQTLRYAKLSPQTGVNAVLKVFNGV